MPSPIFVMEFISHRALKYLCLLEEWLIGSCSFNAAHRTSAPEKLKQNSYRQLRMT
ncbi:hypothetical protein [Nostoc piscinale]|uniref:hypothetical protein n=1 Tax=Nostoc piscinale TaxID=224012 RepID=UPI00130D8841|nr:hypothetical protein [Nostoc piscinale]